MKIGYARVSTVEQNLDLQMDALKQAGCDRIFEDRMTGRHITRPGMQAMLEFARAGDTIVIWRLDRLGRNTRQMLELSQLLQEKGIDLLSLSENLDTKSPAGRFFFTIFSSVAQYERELIEERKAAGVAAAKKRGVRFGRKPKLSKAKINILKTTYEKSPHLSCEEIAQEFGISTRSLYRYLNQPD